MNNQATSRRQHSMSFLNRLYVSHDGDCDRAPEKPCKSNVLPFPPRRVLLPVTLTGNHQSDARTQLKTLLHSPIGVYAVSTEIIRDDVRVQFDIAPEDLGFTLHALMTSLPQAMIGPLRRATHTREAN
jgi:hypothetical protein